MYFYAIEKLKSEFKNGPLPDNRVVSYVICIAVLNTLIQKTSSFQYSDAFLNYTYIVVLLLLAIFGTAWLYYQNGGASGRDFIGRYMVLRWVALIRYATVAIPLMILILVLNYVFISGPGKRLWIDFIVMSILEAGYFLYLGKHMADLRKQ